MAPQQDRARQTRHSILSAAAAVFDAKGFDAATISDIIREAATTKGAIYFHFDSKEALAQAIVAEQGTWLTRVPANTGHPLQEVIDISYAFSAALRNDPLLRASIRLTVERGTFGEPDPDAYRQWEKVVEQRLQVAKRLGHLQTACSPLKVARTVAGSMTGLQLASEVTSGRKDLDRRIEAFWQIVLPGIAAAEYLPALRIRPPHRTVGSRPHEAEDGGSRTP